MMCMADFTKHCHIYHMLSYLSTYKKEMNRNSEMDQLVNVLAAKPGDLSSIPGTHKVDEKKSTSTSNPLISKCYPQHASILQHEINLPLQNICLYCEDASLSRCFLIGLIKD